MTESVYVHIDTTSNAVLTKGLTATDFANSIVHFPQNLLLLDPSASAGEKISVELLKEMRNLMQEGIIFSFDQVGLIDGKYRIPIYVIEDYIWKLKGTRYREEEIIATLIYSVTDRHWQLVEDADLSYLPLK